jgi:hypothetical protein
LPSAGSDRHSRNLPSRINAPFLEAEKNPAERKTAAILPIRIIAKEICSVFFTLQNTTNTMPTAPGQLAKFLLQIETSVLAFDVAMK